jgi:hypothetical protein
MNVDLKAYQYRRKLEESRGHNYQYPNSEQQIKNDKLGYEHHLFKDNTMDTWSEDEAKKAVKKYREKNYYSRIVCYPNEIIGGKCFSVIFRSKAKK